MVFFKPIHCGGSKETADFVSSEIENLGSPVFPFAHLRVFIFIAGFAVKIHKADGIFREMGRDPVHDNADSVFMKGIHKIHEIFRFSVTAGGCEISEALVTPGTVEGMFRYRKKFDVGVMHFFCVSGKFFGAFSVIEEISVLIFFPGTDVNFINVHRAVVHIPFCAMLKPFFVAPSVFQRTDHGSGSGSCFGMESIGVGFFNNFAGRGFDGEFIAGVIFKAVNAAFPDSVAYFMHGVRPCGPEVPIAYYGNVSGVRRPGSEHNAFFAASFYPMRAKEFICAIVGSLVEKIDRKLKRILFFCHKVLLSFRKRLLP